VLRKPSINIIPSEDDDDEEENSEQKN